MSDLQIIAQHISNLITDAEDTAVQVRHYSKQMNEMLVFINNAMKGTNQQGHHDLMTQLLVSQKKLDYAADCLASISKSGKEWMSEHISNSGTKADAVYSSDNSFVSMDSQTNEDLLKPTRKTPRDLSVSQYGFSRKPNGMEIYDSPLEVDRYLYAKQGSAYTNFKGTCGLCSCANVLRLAGVDYGEKEMIDYAANQQGGFFSKKLCYVNPFNPYESGGTTPMQRQQILNHFGISSSIEAVKIYPDGKVSIETINDIAKWISEGRGVIVDVDAGLFYNRPKDYGRGHAVTITSVEKNKGHAVTVTSVEKNKYGDVTGFYILDSNRGTVRYNSWEIQEMLRNFVGINVTSQIIR